MIQIDVQMPTNCLDCPACNEYLTCAIPVNGRKWGENDVSEFGQGRPEWCPLKELKENKWIDHLYRFNDTRFECKSCHRTAAKSYPFCPWCGLKMTGTEIDKDFSEGAEK